MNASGRSPHWKPRPRAIAIAIACGSLLALPSCIPSLRHPEPVPDLPEAFNGVTSPENSAQLKIEEFFEDPLLTGLIHQALYGNQELRILAENVQIASNEILARQGAYLPFIYPGGNIGITKYSRYTETGAGILDDAYNTPNFPKQFLPNPLPDFLLGFTLLWTPDVWYQLHNLKDAAAMRYFAAGEGRAYVVTRVIAEIADNYYRLLALDKRLENLSSIIALQERSLEIARARFAAARGTDLAVQRFAAEVRRYQSQRLIVLQDIIQAENRINFLVGRFPQPVARRPVKTIEEYIDLALHALSVGVPAQLLRLRPDVRQAERELAATGLDVTAARKRFYPQGFINGGVGYQAFNPRYLFITPEALIGNVVANALVPFINRKAIKADYFTANARQLQAVYDFQRTVLNAFTDVVNRITRVQNYLISIDIKKQQVAALVQAVEDASSLYQNPRIEVPIDYLDVLTAQNALFEARLELIDIKQEQLAAVINAYQALGGGAYLSPVLTPAPLKSPPWRIFDWNPFVRHSKASKAAGSGPPPPPPPAVVEGGPQPPPPPAETGPQPPPPPTSESGPFQPPSAPTGSGPEPGPAPSPESGPEPIPSPTRDGPESGTAPDTDAPPG